MPGTCQEHGKVYAVYLITVKKTYSDGTCDTWDVYRRYSDFHDLHTNIQEKVGFSRFVVRIIQMMRCVDNQ